MEQLKVLTENISDDEEEEEQPKPRRKPRKVIYVDSDGEEIENDKPVVIINKIAPTISSKRPPSQMIPPKNIPVFV